MQQLRPFGAACVLAASLGAWACNREPDPPASATDVPALPETQKHAAWSPGGQTEAPPLPTVLAALQRTHRDVRAQLGPHRLKYTAHFETRPEPPPPPNPPTDAPVPAAHAIDDELVLVWASAKPRFSLRQSNDTGRGRHVIRIGEALYSQLDHRPWLAAPAEGELDELWLDDAQRSAYDAVAFVAPAVLLTAAPEQSETTLVLALSLARTDPAPERAHEQESAFREAAQFDAIEGELRIDRATGIWSTLHLRAEYHVDTNAGAKTIRGVLAYDGTLESLPGDVATAAIVAPPDAAPLRDRTRLQDEERRLLHGLVTP